MILCENHQLLVNKNNLSYLLLTAYHNNVWEYPEIKQWGEGGSDDVIQNGCQWQF